MIVSTISACVTSGCVLRRDDHRVDPDRRDPSYSMVTWLLPSGRSQGIVPFCRNSVSRLMMRWASAIGSGISSGVSLQA